MSIPSEGAEDGYVGTVGAATFPGDIGERIWLDYEKAVLARSNGKLRLRMLIRGETGGEESRMPSLLRGRVHVSSFSDSGMSRVVPEFGLLTAPFLFDSLEEVHFVVDNYLKEPYAALAEDKGFVILNWQDVGWLNIYGGKPLLTPADTAGYRMRSLQSTASILFLHRKTKTSSRRALVQSPHNAAWLLICCAMKKPTLPRSALKFTSYPVTSDKDLGTLLNLISAHSLMKSAARLKRLWVSSSWAEKPTRDRCPSG